MSVPAFCVQQGVSLLFFLSSTILLRRIGAFDDVSLVVELHSQSESHTGQNVFDFVQRLAPEILGLQHLGFALLDQITDGLDVRVLQTIVGTDRKLKLINRFVEMLVVRRDRLLHDRLGLFVNLFLEVDENRHVVFDQLRGQSDGEFRCDAAVGPDLEQQFVVIGILPQTSGLDVEIDLGYRRMNRINRDVTDRQVIIEIAVSRDVTTPPLDPHFNVQVSAFAHRGAVDGPVEDLHIIIQLDVAGFHFSGFGARNANGLRFSGVEFEGDLFKVEDDIGGILNDARNRRELVQHAFDSDGGDGGSFD